MIFKFSLFCFLLSFPGNFVVCLNTDVHKTIYVDGSQSRESGSAAHLDQHTVCGSESNPCETIQQGINAASNGDIVMVRPYQYVLSHQLEFGGKTLSLKTTVPEGTSVACDPTQHLRFATFQHIGYSHSTVLLEGFSIETCSAPDWHELDPLALYSNDMLHSEELIERKGGGAIAVLGGVDLTVRNVNFSHNQATLGGAVYIAGSAAPVFERCNFTANRAYLGGAVFTDANSDPRFRSTWFVANSAVNKGGAVYSSNQNLQTYAMYSDCTFMNNFVPESSENMCAMVDSPNAEACMGVVDSPSNGVDCCKGGAIYAHGSSQVMFARTLFAGNRARAGGAVAMGMNAAPQFHRCQFAANQASRFGGGVACGSASAPAFGSCLFKANVAQRAGGAAFATDSTAPHFHTCVFSENRALPTDLSVEVACQSENYKDSGFGGAVYAGGSCRPIFEDSMMNHNVAMCKGGAAYSDGSSQPSFSSCTMMSNTVQTADNLPVSNAWDHSSSTQAIFHNTEGFP